MHRKDSFPFFVNIAGNNMCIKNFLECVGNFCRNTSMPGFRYLTDSGRTRPERCLWCLLELFLVVMAIVMMGHTWEGALEDPLVTSLESNSYPISEIPFPGIAICNINKISKRRAVSYAKALSRVANVSFDYIFNSVKLLGNLYDYEVTDTDEFLEFQTYLEQFGMANGGSSIDSNSLYYIMEHLTTPCNDLLYECSWEGGRRSCHEMFKLRRTYEGYCCTFNYADNNSLGNRPKLHKEGWNHGLSVIIRNDPGDYFYPLVSAVGTSVHIFEHDDYPDASSGDLIEELVAVGTESFLNLDANVFYSVPEVRNYPIAKRKCIFSDEMETTFGSYSSSNCLVDCRVESMKALCNCLPFVLPVPGASPCILSDLPCLNKYKGKWQNLYPGNMGSAILKREKESSLRCGNCYASCEHINYHVSSTEVPLNVKSSKSPIKNFSIVRIYFSRRYAKLFRQDVVYRWFELIGNFGGLLGIFLGMSLISVAEFLSYIIFQFTSFLGGSCLVQLTKSNP